MNENLTVFPSKARTATETSARFTNYHGKGAILTINVTAVTATPSVVFTVRGVDSVSGATYDLLVSAAITATGDTQLTIYPGLTAAANVTATALLPMQWEVIATHGDADSITYSVGASVMA